MDVSAVLGASCDPAIAMPATEHHCQEHTQDRDLGHGCHSEREDLHRGLEEERLDQHAGNGWCPAWSVAESTPVRYVPERHCYEQRAAFQQADRMHEEVLEVESPLAAHCAAHTWAARFVLLGDQNAGKSTLLHAFAHSRADGHLLLTSYLPLLAASFRNVRLLPATLSGDDDSPDAAPAQANTCMHVQPTHEGHCSGSRPPAPPMDVPPFLDTDLGNDGCWSVVCVCLSLSLSLYVRLFPSVCAIMPLCKRR
jgi:hypothetical protein